MLLAVAAMLSVPTNACKCLDGSGNAVDSATSTCCRSVGGVFQDGNDCKASSISESLSGYVRLQICLQIRIVLIRASFLASISKVLVASNLMASFDL
jgi:hypothetical protein